MTTNGPANGLELRLFLNASWSSATGVNLSVFVDAYNPSTSTANVTSASDWVVPLNYTDGTLCGDDTYAQNPTVGFAIAQGHYTPSNVTQAKLLNLVNPDAFYYCPLYLGYAGPTGFLFQPLSDMATSYGCNQQMCMSGNASTGLRSSSSSLVPGTGYWDQEGAFVSFPKGTYTVLAEDQWGALTLAYFSVSLLVQSPSASNGASSTTDESSSTASTVTTGGADVIVESAINSTSACSPKEDWESSSAMNALRLGVMSQPGFTELAQNRSYSDAGYSCSLVNGTEFTIDFEYSDVAHPFHVCGDGTAYPYYIIEARIYLLPTGYDLSKTAYSMQYYDSQNLTVTCTTTTTS